MSNELRKLVKLDRQNYKCRNRLIDFYKKVNCDQIKFFEKVIIISRKYRAYRDDTRIIGKIKAAVYSRKFNLIARKSNINIQAHFGKNLKIFHENIIVNQYAMLGDNVQLHGNNCIGNNGKNIKNCPIIGNNVEIGYGAVIIGNIKIADNIIIGANSIVNKSFLEPNIVIAGNPAKKIKNRND